MYHSQYGNDTDQSAVSSGWSYDAARLQAIIGATQDLIWRTDRYGNMREESHGWQRFTGQSTSESRELGWLKTIHAEDRAYLLNSVSQKAITDERVEAKCQILRHDGRYRIFQICQMPIFDAQKVIQEWVYVGHDITEQQQALHQIEQQADVIKLQSRLIELAHDAILVRKPSGNVISWNRGAEQLYGWRAEEVRDLCTHHFLHTQFPVSLTAQEQLLEQHGYWEGELIHHRRDGIQVIVESRQVLMRDASGNPDAVLEVNRDITERKQAEYVSKERINMAIDAAEIGTWDWDLLSNELLWSNQCKALFGFVPQTHMSYALFLDALHPDDRMHVDTLMQRCLRLKEEYHAEYRVVWPDGSIHWITMQGKVFIDVEGRITRISGVAMDITSRRAWEQRIQETLQALLTMAQIVVEGKSADALTRSLTAMPDVSDRYNVEHQLAELTRSVLGGRRLGITAVDAETGRLQPIAVAGLSPKQERVWWEDTPRYSLQEGWKLEQVVLLQADQVLLLEPSNFPPYLVASLRHWPVQQLLCAPMRIGEQFIGTLTLDYGTEEHHFTDQEIALVAAAARLMALAIERRRLILEHAQAQASILALQETNDRMGEFISIAGHELRTPLTTINASVQLAQKQIARLLMQDRMQTEQIEKMLYTLSTLLARAEHQIGLQNRLISDLLDSSRMHAEQLTLEIQRCDLFRLVQDVVEEQQTRTPLRTIQLQCTTPDLLWVNVDADRIQQVVSNYLSNALKYSNAEQVVGILIERVGAAVRVSVQDHGPGLTLSQQEHLWERFYRVPDIEIQTGSGVGLGLGLYICRTIIEMHGGQVGVSSMPGAGSAFWFTLLLAE